MRQRARADGGLDEPRGAEADVRDRRGAYWSRSRKKLWHKGEESGHVQKVKEIRLDCDEDVVLLEVEQLAASPAIPAGTAVFSRRLEDGQWVAVDPVLKDPQEIYRNNMTEHDILRRLSATIARAQRRPTRRVPTWRGCSPRATTQS